MKKKAAAKPAKLKQPKLAVSGGGDAQENMEERQHMNASRRTEILARKRARERDLEKALLSVKTIKDDIKQLQVDIDALDDELLTDSRKGVLFPVARKLSTDATPALSIVAAAQQGGAQIVEETVGDLAIAIVQEGEKFRIERYAHTSEKFATLKAKGPAVPYTRREDAIAVALELAIDKLWKKKEKDTAAADAIRKMQDAHRDLPGHENEADYTPKGK